MKLHAVNPQVFFLALVLSWQAFGQGSTTSQLDDLVVTGTRTPKLAVEGPVRTEVINASDIKERQHRDLSEALLDVPGIILVDSTGKEGKSAIMQGLGGEHVLVLMDGAPLMQNASSGVDLTQIPASDIERIEVVKGGASALYGGQAMGGVINVITKSATEKFRYQAEIGRDETPDTPKTVEGTRSAPSYNLAKLHLSGKAVRTGLKLSLNHRRAQALDRDARSLAKDTPDIDRVNAQVAVEQELSAQHKLLFEVGGGLEKNRSYSSRIQPDGSWIPTHNDGEVRRERAKLGYLGNLGQEASVNVYALTEKTADRLSLEDDPRTLAEESLKDSLFRRDRIEAQIDFAPAANQVATLGLVAERNALDQRNLTQLAPGQLQRTIEVDGKTSKSLEAFVQNDWIMDRSEVIAGLRVTHDPAFWEHFDPKINYSLQPAWFGTMDGRLRFSVGTGYRIPNLKERYYVLDHRSFAGYIVYGNENLRPEESINYQAGLELARSRELNLGANLFVNQVRGLILSVEKPTGSAERIFQFENMDRSLIYGTELSANWQATSRLRWTPSFTFTKAVNPDSGLIVPNRPFYLGQMNLRLDVGSKGSNLTAAFRYFGDSYATLDNTEKYSAYSTVDLRYNHSFNKNAGVYFGARNLLDSKRAAKADSAELIFDQRPEDGRVFILGLSIEG